MACACLPHGSRLESRAVRRISFWALFFAARFSLTKTKNSASLKKRAPQRCGRLLLALIKSLSETRHIRAGFSFGYFFFFWLKRAAVSTIKDKRATINIASSYLLMPNRPPDDKNQEAAPATFAVARSVGQADAFLFAPHIRWDFFAIFLGVFKIFLKKLGAWA